MKIEQIEQVITVAELNSISLAAESLFISQPNLSLSIKKLETELGYSIFLRTNKGVETTPLGQKFIDSAKIIMLQFRQLGSLKDNLAQRSQKSFSLAHMHYRYVNHALAELFAREKNSDLRLEVREGVRSEVIDCVCRRMCDIGLIGMYSHYHKITIRQLETKGLQYFRLCSSPVTIILGKGNPLYESPRQSLTLEDVQSFPVVMYEESELEPFTSILEAVGLGKQAHRIVVAERCTLMDFLDKTDAISVTTTNKIAYQNTEYYPNIRHFTLENCLITGEIGWIKREDTVLSEMALSFLQILSSYFTVINGELPL